jgi:U-box domain
MAGRPREVELPKPKPPAKWKVSSHPGHTTQFEDYKLHKKAAHDKFEQAITAIDDSRYDEGWKLLHQAIDSRAKANGLWTANGGEFDARHSAFELKSLTIKESLQRAGFGPRRKNAPEQCAFCKRVGHVVADCRIRDKPCRHCGKNGHPEWECFHRPCVYCKKTGHKPEACFFKPASARGGVAGGRGRGGARGGGGPPPSRGRGDVGRGSGPPPYSRGDRGARGRGGDRGRGRGRGAGRGDDNTDYSDDNAPSAAAAAAASASQEPPESFLCPISYEVMRDPVVDSDGNSYEREEIEAWLKKHGTSPITRAPLTVEDLIPNRALRDLIEASAWNPSTGEQPHSAEEALRSLVSSMRSLE